jgi:ribosomal protein S12 methylthiotransferase accessory factor
VRAGIVRPAELVEPTAADPPDLHDAFLAGEDDSLADVSAGGMGRTAIEARAAAVGEAVERYCASQARFPLRRGGEHVDISLFSDAQRRAPGFAWPTVDAELAWYAPMARLDDGAELWVPEALVGLGSRQAPAVLPSTSSGLAAGPDIDTAILAGALELLERDALAATWLGALPGRHIPLDDEPTVRAFDLTQAWNPFPVVAVAGTMLARGFPRLAFGIACRPTLEEAREKAFLEWVQGVVFAGHQLARGATTDENPRDFVGHATYWARRPDGHLHWPLWKSTAATPRSGSSTVGARALLGELIAALSTAGIRLLARELTLPDVRALGVRVVRVVSAELALLSGDAEAPFLGGRVLDCAWRYPGLAPVAAVPNSLPHPLG